MPSLSELVASIRALVDSADAGDGDAPGSGDPSMPAGPPPADGASSDGLTSAGTAPETTPADPPRPAQESAAASEGASPSSVEPEQLPSAPAPRPTPLVDAGLTIDRIRGMTPADINARWEEVKGVMRREFGGMQR